MTRRELNATTNTSLDEPPSFHASPLSELTAGTLQDVAPSCSPPWGSEDSSAKPRDALGRIARRTEAFGATTVSYDYFYDAAGRLTDVKTGSTVVEHFLYDVNGNRLSHRTNDAIIATYDDQDRLTSYDGVTYTCRPNGELATRTAGGQTWSYTYDALGNLLTVTTPEVTIAYLVDGRNRRVGKKKNGVLAKQWLYGDGLSPVAELDGTGNVVARFVYGSRPNVPDFVLRDGKVYRIISDQLGSPRLVIGVNEPQATIALQVDYSALASARYSRGKMTGFLSDLRADCTIRKLSSYGLGRGTMTHWWGGG
jgi:YD repeat-containing protein